MPVQRSIGMIADDLTGACDAGVQFAESGLLTTVWLDYPEAGSEMTVLSTDSRAVSPDTARTKVREACLQLERLGAGLVYKKIDSTLCGHVEAEIEAALDATGRACAWMCPAFPDMGRTVVGGWLNVNAEQRMPVPRGRRIVVKDAATNADLARIAEEARTADPKPLLVGSAGLAAHLAGRGGTRVPPQARPALPRHSLILLCIGSKNPVTAAQVECLERHRPGVGMLRMNWDYRDTLALEDRAGALIMTGGDTARRMCAILNARGIRLEREILPGIALGRILGGAADGTLMATKAGGFGEEDALLRIVGFFESCIPP